MRTIIIGDVHGCIDELEALCREVSVRPKDRVIFIGDIINKGPNSLAVWQLFRDLKAEAVLGNHELRLIESHSGESSRKGLYRQMRIEFGKYFKSLLDDIQTWPLYIKEDAFIAVHAGLVPGKKLSKCSAAALCNIRTWDGKGRDLQNAANPPWWECMEIDRLTVFGHWAAKRGVFDHPRIVGLDTGCVYGHELSALVLPDMEVVSVKAKRRYCDYS